MEGLVLMNESVRFVNRNREMAELERQYQAERPALVILYGRRRVGKTALIHEFIRRHANSFYFLATKQTCPENLGQFRLQASEFLRDESLIRDDADWPRVFDALSTETGSNRRIIAIDEMQYLGMLDPAFPSVLQKIWDTCLSRRNIMLILCGSLVSMMTEQTLNYSSPLYGRRTAQLKLMQVPFEYYHEFYPEEQSNDDLLPFYAVTGGIPRYVEEVRTYADVYEAIEQTMLQPQSYLFAEPWFLLSEEVPEIGPLFRVLRAIAMGNRKMADIAAALAVKQEEIRDAMKLLADLDLVECIVPVTEENPEKSKQGLYRICDHYLDFWFHFVYPYQALLERGETGHAMERIRSGFVQNYLSYVYEDVCRDMMWKLCGEGLWDFVFTRVGSYWGTEPGETDILALDKEGKNMIIGECKYSGSPKGLSVLHKLENKSGYFAEKTGCQNVCYIIFGKSGFSEGLRREAEMNPRIRLVEHL